MVSVENLHHMFQNAQFKQIINRNLDRLLSDGNNYGIKMKTKYTVNVISVIVEIKAFFTLCTGQQLIQFI